MKQFRWLAGYFGKGNKNGTTRFTSDKEVLSDSDISDLEEMLTSTNGFKCLVFTYQLIEEVTE